MRFCKNRCDLQTLHLSSRERTVHLAVQVIGRAESDGREEFTTLCFRQLFSGCQRQHFFHRHSFKTRRLLECIADAGVCAVVNIITGNIFLIQEDFSAVCFLNAGKYFGQRRFSATVRSGNHQHFPVLYLKTDVVDEAAFSSLFVYFKGKIVYFQHICTSFVFGL